MASAYIRVSSRSQNLQSQQDAISRAAKARGEHVTRWYCETASGRSVDRPELIQLLNDARGGQLDTLYVFKLDRLTRSGIRDTLRIIDQLRTCGCELVSICDGFSLDGPASDIVLAVLSWAAQMERQAIGDRISSARTRLAAQCRPWGRPSRIDGDLRDRILSLKAQDYSVRRIAMSIGVPKTTIQRVLISARKQPAIIG